MAREWMVDLGGRWHRGMVDGRTGQLCSGTYADGTGSFWVRDERADIVHPNERYPDLDHPGTRAFLLEDVRKAWPGHGVDIELCEGVFGDRVGIWKRDKPQGTPDVFVSRTHPIAHALIAALKAAP